MYTYLYFRTPTNTKKNSRKQNKNNNKNKHNKKNKDFRDIWGADMSQHLFFCFLELGEVRFIPRIGTPIV